MTDHLKEARQFLAKEMKDPERTTAGVVLLALNNILLHLEQSPVLPPPDFSKPWMIKDKDGSIRHPTTEEWAAVYQKPIPEEPASETPSLTDTVMPEATSDTLSISSTWSFPASPVGFLQPSVLEAISGWLSSQSVHGSEQVEVTLSIRTSKGSIPPDGSLSPSTEAPILEGSGAAGEIPFHFSVTGGTPAQWHPSPDSSIHEPPRQEGKGE